jgi:hypothetical protein
MHRQQPLTIIHFYTTGYYSVKEMKAGHESGARRDTFYVPAKYRNAMRMYQAVQPPYYARDFPAAWRDIDHLDLPPPVTTLPESSWFIE